jgi:NAD(P)H-flavin reductase/rubredoxin
MLALIISIPLLLTSNWFFTKFLWKNWKTLQRLSYPMFALVAIHIYMIWWEIWPIIAVIVWFIIINIAFFKNKKIKKIVSNSPKWLCVPCGYIYDQDIWDVDSWVLPWTRFEDIPNDWLCPVCWVGKSDCILLDSDIEITEWEIESIEYLTEDIIELKLKIEKIFDYVSGQFLSFVFDDSMWKINRSYSIANKEWNIYTFLIKLKPDWKAWILLKTKKVWDKINCTSISWNFKLQNTDNEKVFIATWTWLAPIYAMLLNTSVEINKKLYFWAANLKDLFYIDKLKEIKNLELNIYLSREQVEWYNFWRVNLEKISVWKDTEIYICWNPAMANDAISFFEKQGITKNIYFERF